MKDSPHSTTCRWPESRKKGMPSSPSSGEAPETARGGQHRRIREWGRLMLLGLILFALSACASGNETESPAGVQFSAPFSAVLFSGRIPPLHANAPASSDAPAEKEEEGEAEEEEEGEEEEGEEEVIPYIRFSDIVDYLVGTSPYVPGPFTEEDLERLSPETEKMGIVLGYDPESAVLTLSDARQPESKIELCADGSYQGTDTVSGCRFAMGFSWPEADSSAPRELPEPAFPLLIVYSRNETAAAFLGNWPLDIMDAYFSDVTCREFAAYCEELQTLGYSRNALTNFIPDKSIYYFYGEYDAGEELSSPSEGDVWAVRAAFCPEEGGDVCACISLYHETEEGYEDGMTGSSDPWPSEGPLAALPAPPPEYRVKLYNDGKKQLAIIGQAVTADFDSYLRALQELGYTVGAEEAELCYEARNKSGASAFISCHNGVLLISLDIPED